ncbi:unnamed protein product [Chilo suppressalis]|uniref:Uncharacterized protein n=1 Tax=Chilo suppressalis TaxID=168631 RepID=A0ABN8BH34_CHISP|nr:unnamed protein product [Chilo suppressalis]
MNPKLLDVDDILSRNDQWRKLEELWGNPVDLDTDEDIPTSKLRPVFSTLDLRKSTFDSSFLFKTVKRKVARQMSKSSVLDYNEFLQDLQHNAVEDIPRKQFYYVSGQVLSAMSVEDICTKIDDIFKSIERLCSATSTIRLKRNVDEIVQCSFSCGDLSFDDTVDPDQEKHASSDVDKYIEEAFEQLNSTILEELWGNPVDLDTDEDIPTSKLRPVFSTLDLRKSTFDSSFLFKTVKRKVARQMSKSSVLDYNEFLQDLQHNAVEDIPRKQFYYVSGQVLSAMSVEDICTKIDDIFKSIERLCSATSTIRLKRNVDEIVQCSFSCGDLSFDDTVDPDQEKHASSDVDKYIEEAFEQLNSTIVSIVNKNATMDEAAKDSVTALVKIFSNILKAPGHRQSRRRRESNDKFKDLAEFWRSKTCKEGEQL